MKFTRDNLMTQDLKTMMLFEGLDFSFTHAAIDIYRVNVDEGGFVNHFVPDPTHLQLVYFLYNAEPFEKNVDNTHLSTAIEWEASYNKQRSEPQIGDRIQTCKRVQEFIIPLEKESASQLLKICRTLVWSVDELSE